MTQNNPKILVIKFVYFCFIKNNVKRKERPEVEIREILTIERRVYHYIFNELKLS